MSSADGASGRKGPGALLLFKSWLGPHAVVQVLGFVSLLALFTLLAGNAAETMARAGISFGFDFLWRAANFEIGETVLPFSAGDTYLRAILAGLTNTVQVAILGCILATLIGVASGVALLSGNLLLAGLIRTYVEIVRNTPLLLQLFFWLALAKSFPPPRSAIAAFDVAYLSNRGIFLPGIAVDNVTGAAVLAGLLVVAGFIAFLVACKRRGRLNLGGFSAASAGLIAALAAISLLTGVRASVEVPALTGFNIRGGVSLTPEFAALLLGLTVKFSAMIAEIVRAGILSVHTGQWQAARALGLDDAQIMRHVILPQALKVITPPTVSVYLDLIKDSSLAVAIGYPDLVGVINTTANTTGQSLEALAILVALFLCLNLAVSMVMNRYNKRVALRGSRQA